MTAVERFRKLALKRGLTPGRLLDASPEDFDLLLLSIRREFVLDRNYDERAVNELLKNWLEVRDAAILRLDFSHEFADANTRESDRRAARKAAWQQPGSAA